MFKDITAWRKYFALRDKDSIGSDNLRISNALVNMRNFRIPDCA